MDCEVYNLEIKVSRLMNKLLLREKEYCILINLQRKKHTYLYSSVRVKRKQS